MQLHEYLGLIHDGTHDDAASDTMKLAAVALARSCRDALKLDAWQEPEPAHVFARRCRSQDALLVHVPCGNVDCFVIAVFRNGEPGAREYILFDIGAEYLAPTLECPVLGSARPATEADIRRCIPLLPGNDSPFAVVELRGGTYMQVFADTDGFHLEHQRVTTGAHYRRAGPVSADEAANMLVSYACGKYEWAYQPWEQMALPAT